jgi:TetR/AcrR family transcriptional regulator
MDTAAFEHDSRESKGDRTRAKILASAERQFALRGFAETRLEDVAEEVGLRRAALFYHFRDKQALYDAVLADVFGDLLERLGQQLQGSGPVPDRIDACIEIWVDAVGARPSLARFLMREAAGADPEVVPPLSDRGAEFLDRGRRLFEEGVASGVLHPVRQDPFHVISAVVGSTVFYVAALRVLLPSMEFDPLEPGELEAHKRDVLQIVRHLLGYGGRAAGGGQQT